MNIHIGIPQLIYILLIILGLILAGSEHGKEKTGTHNIFPRLFMQIVFLIILCWGGFFG